MNIDAIYNKLHCHLARSILRGKSLSQHPVNAKNTLDNNKQVILKKDEDRFSTCGPINQAIECAHKFN